MKIEILRSIPLLEGEEMLEFADEVMKAISRNADMLGGEPGNIWLRGIYNGFIVARDMGNDRFVRADWKRGKEGDIKLSKPKVVRQAWETVGELPKEGGQQREEAEPTPAEVAEVPEIVEVRRSFWEGVL